jgi:hypothetical protein
MKGPCRELSGMNIQGAFRAHSGNFQGTFRDEHSGKFQRNFGDHSRNIQGILTHLRANAVDPVPKCLHTTMPPQKSCVRFVIVFGGNIRCFHHQSFCCFIRRRKALYTLSAEDKRVDRKGKKMKEKERKEKERKEKERKGKERKYKEMQGNTRKEKERKGKKRKDPPYFPDIYSLNVRGPHLKVCAILQPINSANPLNVIPGTIPAFPLRRNRVRPLVLTPRMHSQVYLYAP